MIGNAADAALIDSLMLVEDEDYDWVGVTPKGWKYLASGQYRHAFLSPSGVVYKKPTSTQLQERSAGYDDCNVVEYNSYLAAQKMVFDNSILEIAECFLYGDILAMEFVMGSDYDCNQDIASAFDIAQSIWPDRCDFTCDSNFRVRNGKVVLIDYAM